MCRVLRGRWPSQWSLDVVGQRSRRGCRRRRAPGPGRSGGFLPSISTTPRVTSHHQSGRPMAPGWPDWKRVVDLGRGGQEGVAVHQLDRAVDRVGGPSGRPDRPASGPGCRPPARRPRPPGRSRTGRRWGTRPPPARRPRRPAAAQASRSAVIMARQQALAAVGGRHGHVGERGGARPWRHRGRPRWCRSCAACPRCGSPSTAAQRVVEVERGGRGTRPRSASAPAGQEAGAHGVDPGGHLGRRRWCGSGRTWPQARGPARRAAADPGRDADVRRLRTGLRGPRSRPSCWPWPGCRSGC